MRQLLEGLSGILCLMDMDIVLRSNQEEHDTCLTATMECLDAAWVTLNLRVWKEFLGHVLSADGIRVDPNKTSAIHAMSPPMCECVRFMEIVNKMGKFSPNMAELS